MSLYFVNDYRKRSANYGVFECDECGDTCDFAAYNQWFEIDIHGNWHVTGGNRHFCSATCLLRWANGTKGSEALLPGIWSDRPRAPMLPAGYSSSQKDKP